MENKLTQEQIGFFELNGYLALEAVTTSEELEWLRCIYDRLLRKRVGWEQGYKEGWSQGHQEYMDVIEQLKKIITQVADQRHDFIESTESDLVALAFDVAEKLVHHQISNDDVIYHTIKSMLDYTVDHEKVLIRVHPEELAKLEPHRQEF